MAGVRALGVHHVSLNVTDVAAAVEFYVDTLGLGERGDRPDFGFGGAWLDVGGQQIHLLEAAPASDLGQHVALQVDDLAACIAELRAGAVQVSDASPVGTGLQAFLHDPAGNLVELHQPA